MKDRIKEIIKENIDVNSKILNTNIDSIEKISRVIVEGFKHNNKLLIFGNGGSAADAQHIAAEFINKFKFDREPLPAIALTTDSSILTCISNDSSFSYVFEKQIKALGKKGDIALAITTSDIDAEEGGHSSDLTFGLKAARNKGLITIGFVGEKSNEILNLLDHYVQVPSKETGRVQEAHILIAHIICELVEQEMFH
jgi:D-sedoheptulose 7-phosphate isomerase